MMKKSDLSVFKSILMMALAMIILLFIGWLIIPPLAANSISRKADFTTVDKLIEKSELNQENAISLIEQVNYHDFENAISAANDTSYSIAERKSSFISALIDNQEIQQKLTEQLSDKKFNTMLDLINTNKKLIPVLFPSFKKVLIKQVEKYFENENKIE